MRRLTTPLAALCAIAPGPAWAAGSFDGAGLGLVWTLPFVGMLLSIALGPLLAPHFWHHHYGKVAGFWAACVVVAMLATFGPAVTVQEVVHLLLLEYLPFVLLLLSLFVVAGGIRITGTLSGTPAVNTLMLLVGTLMAGWMGTTGASMLLIRPMLRANEHRRRRAHTFIFFIFLVSNIGGSLTPLGDPPLFLGFLQGVDFFWTLRALAPETALLAALLLGLYWAIDSWFYRREAPLPPPEGGSQRLALRGGVNILLLGAIVAAVLASGVLRLGTAVEIAGVAVQGQNLLRDVALAVIAVLSLRLTPAGTHAANGFDWEPMIEVAKLFIGIFVSIAPVIAILRAGEAGALGFVMGPLYDPAGQPIPAAFFWATGLLSGFLDNAPTYLVFFEVAGGDPQNLMGPQAATLSAISAGAVFMGALSYIGNAPNFMVRAIAQRGGVPMPGFFGYCLWSFVILMPLFALMTVIFYA